MSDFEVKLEEAKGRLPLRRLMEQRGRGPANRNWKSFKCPYCQKTAAGVFQGKGRGELFKCHHTSCPSGTSAKGGAWDEVAFLAHELGLNRKDAAVVYLKEAGLWQERQPSPSILPGKTDRKVKVPVGPNPEAIAASQECRETFISEQPNPDTIAYEAREGESGAANGGTKAQDGTALNEILDDRAADALPPPSEPLPVALVPTAIQSREGMASGDEAGEALADEVAGTAGNGASGEIDPGGCAESSETAAADKDEPHLEPSATPSSLALAALREFYDGLPHLAGNKASSLWQKRGLRRATAERYGLRTNPRSNLDLLNALEAKYPLRALIDAGLFIQGQGVSPRPNPKFYGWGIVSKKPKEQRRNEDDKWVRGWCEPILIPYSDQAGKVHFLRPHKDQVAGTCNRFYIPCPVPVLPSEPVPVVSAAITPTAPPAQPLPECRQALITEGELKGLAALQILGSGERGHPRWAVGALPGITNAKPMLSDIVDWLEELGANEVVIVYDNEDKSDPKCPGFVREEWARYDSDIWARHLAQELSKEGFKASVGKLPDDWRDKNLKADWDGALVHLLHKFTNTPAERPLPPEAEIDPAVWKRIHDEFLKVLRSAIPIELLRQRGSLDDPAERHIRSGLERISTVPMLPIGGRNELGIARRIQRFLRKARDDADRLPAEMRNRLTQLAKTYLTFNGRYYALRYHSEKTLGFWYQELAEAEKRRDVEYKRVLEIGLRGVPHYISDFYLKAHFVLKKATGERERFVSIHTIHGVSTPHLALASEAFAQPLKLRKWLLDNCPGATWFGGERELNALQADVAKHVSRMDLTGIELRGYHEESKIWFLEDVAFCPDDREVLPDSRGIFWGEGDGWRQGYKLVRLANAKQPFRLGFPKMFPNRPDPDLKELFREASIRFLEAVGWNPGQKIGYDGFVCLGIAFSCFTSPEIYERWAGTPGLWVHGETQQGKNCVSRWLLPIQGSQRKTGIVLPRSSEPGLSHAFDQYSGLLVWLEEFQPELNRTKPWVMELIKNTFDRASGTKMVFGQELCELRGIAFVNGITTASDPQVKNRYAHVQVSARFRQKDHYDWFEANSPDFFFLGRHILRNRRAFAKLVMETLEEWMRSSDTAGIDSRAKLVYGVAYSAYLAAYSLFQGDFADLRDYRRFSIAKAAEAATEIRQQVNLNQFFTDILSAYEAGVFGRSPSELGRYFMVVENRRAPSPLPPDQRGPEWDSYPWRSFSLFFKNDAVVEQLRSFKASGHREFPLEANDVVSQMKTKPYYINPPKGKSMWRLRFKRGGYKSAQYCCGIDLDKHELGYSEVPTEELKRSLPPAGAEPGSLPRILRADWVDPREGDLFILVHKLLEEDDSNHS